MEAYAISKYNRISTKKLRRVANAVNHLNYQAAQSILINLPQKGARMIAKTLKSAGANLENKEPPTNESKWIVKTIVVNQGPSFKRIRHRARGRADRIHKPTAHLKVVVSEES